MCESLSSQRDNRTGIALALAAVALLSPDSLIVRTVDEPNEVVLLWRGALVATVIVVASGRRGGVRRRFWATGVAGVAAGCCWAVATILFVYAVRRTSVASTLVIVGAGPVFAAAMERLALHERIPRRTWLASGGVAVGIAWIFAGSIGNEGFAGDLAALAGSLSYATFLTLLRRGRGTDMTPALVIGGVVTAAAALAAGGAASMPSARDAALLVVLGGLIVPSSLFLTTLAARHISAAEISLLGRLETVLGPLWVWLALGDAPPAQVVAAGVLIVVVTALHSLAAIRADARAADPASPHVVDVDR
jgi:drug/metabolite transporter (DMT)-like permease